MASHVFDHALQVVLRHEGGFANHPLDPGGATKFGITRRVLARARGRPVTVDDVQRLGMDEARAIYRDFYWKAIRADELPAGLDLAMFDFAVNSGPYRAAIVLQRIVGAKPDGVIGPHTMRSLTMTHTSDTIRQLTRTRLGFLARLTTWATFGRGWKTRVLSVEREALSLAGSLQQKDIPMPDTKTILASRTIWANVTGLLAVVIGILGFDTSSLDTGAVAEAVIQLIAAGSFIASTLFRILATKQIQN